MNLTMKIAFRNMLKHKRRTIISGLAIAIGLASLIFTDGMIIGMEDVMIKNACSTYMGEGQIHRIGFRESNDVNETINNLDSVLNTLKNNNSVKAYSERTIAISMITSTVDAKPVLTVGFNPENEQHISEIDERIVKGSYLSGKYKNEILIGEKLAETLEIAIGDRVVLTVTEAKTNELSQELFRVAGIFKFDVKEMDKGMVFIKLNKARKMLNLGKNSHEIAIAFKNDFTNRGDFFSSLTKNGNEALGWEKLIPELSSALKYTDMSVGLMALILFGIVAFGIVNTLFMSIYERMYEFGVLKAIGTKPFMIFRIILSEAFVLGNISIIIGSILSFFLTLYFSKYGIDYRGIEMSGVTIQNLIYPVSTLIQYIKYPLWILGFTCLASIYPAIYAAKLNPVKAMRKSL